MNPLPHTTAGTVAGSKPRAGLGRWSALLLATALSTSAFAAGGPSHESIPVAQRATPAEPMGTLDRTDLAQGQTLADEEFANSERERAAIAALGFNPDDPLVVAAYREETSADSPYTPFDANSYVADPAFNSGKYIENDFGGSISSPQGYFLGRKVARLDNGDIVVAAMIKNPGGNQTNGFWNLGLSKYSPTGSRRCWVSAGAYGGGQGGCLLSSYSPWVVYPKSDTAYINWVQDIKVVDNFILVSVNRNFNGGTDIDTQVHVFNTDGKYLSTAPVFNHGSYDEMIGGMEVYHTGVGGATTTQVVVTATQFWRDGSQSPKPIFIRYTLGSNGVMTAATDKVVLNTSTNCSAADEWCEAKGIALGFPAILGPAPSIFIAVAKKHASGEYDIVILKVNQNGVADANWQTPWRNISDGGDKNDIPFGIAVKSYGGILPGSSRIHDVYVASNSSRACKPGIGVLRASTSNNGANSAKAIFGGSTAPIVASCLLASSDYGNGLTMQDDKIAIVGLRVFTPLCPGGSNCPEAVVDSTFALVDDNLTVKSFEKYAFDIGATRSKHSGMYGVVGTGDGKFVMTGDTRYTENELIPNWRGKQKVGLLGVAPPTANDTIFKNGFD